MRSLLSLSIAAVILLGFTLPAQAGTEVDVTGQIRWRTEFDDRSFGENTDMAIYNLLRTRLGVGANVGENARVFIQAQDSRVMGASGQSGGLLNTANLDVHQAYLKIMDLWDSGIGLKLGRFEVKTGNERVFGPVDWSNVGRSWEGAKVWYKHEDVALAGMALKKFEPDSPPSDNFLQEGSEDDFNVYGIMAHLVDPAFQFFFTYERDGANEMASGYEPPYMAAGTLDEEDEDCNNLDRMTLGMFFENDVEDMGIDYAINAAYQFGKVHYDEMGMRTVEELDISAYLLNLELGYTIDAERPVRIAGMIDYASGDDDLSDTDWNAYDNLYYTGHKWRGFMDYFVGSHEWGLMDLMARAHVEMAPNWWLMGDFHYFRTAAEYDATPMSETATMTNDVGMEIDISLKTKSIADTKMMAGGSFFMPKDNWVGFDDSETGTWFYFQFLVDFD
jgi:hypothetical protein